MNVHPAARDLEPGTPVEHSSAPATDLGGLARIAECAQLFGIESAAIVDREVPVAARVGGARRPRTAQCDRLNAGQPAQLVHERAEERTIPINEIG